MPDLKSVALLISTSLLPMMAMAQTPGSTATREPVMGTAPGDDAGEEIVVTAQRERGAVPGDIKPELQLQPGAIRSLGVSSVNELLAELAPQTRTGGSTERPVVLLNGQRIGSFAEIRDLPTEAIARVDILPEEVALKYGYPLGQRVVNIVLRERFRAITGEVIDTFTDEGGANNVQAETSLLRIRKDGRFTLNLKYAQRDRLLESQRDITGTTVTSPFDPDGTINRLTPYRTLLAGTQDYSANAVFNRPLTETIAATLNGSFAVAETDSLRGLPRVTVTLPGTNPFSPTGSDNVLSGIVPGLDPLRQQGRVSTGRIGVTLARNDGPWRWTLTSSYERELSNTRTDAGIDPTLLQAALNANDPAVNPYATLPGTLLTPATANRARSVANTGAVDLLVSGSPFRLPAGDVSTSIRVGGQLSGFENDTTRGGLTQSASLTRNIVSSQVNIDLPIASRRNDVLAALGDLSINGNAAIRHLSDVGTLETFGYGMVWSPAKPLNLVVSMTHDRVAPTVQQLGNPAITTLNVPVFDFVRGESVAVAQLTGGNDALRAARKRTFKAEASWKPINGADLTLSAAYSRSHTVNPVLRFPAPTAALEAAFPDRFTRDPDGRLTLIDTRPVNIARSDSDSLRWGINFSQPLKSSTPAPRDIASELGGRGGNDRRPDDRAGQGDNPGRGAGNRGFGGGGGRGGSRVQFALYHTVHLRESVLLDRSLPLLDLLDGASIGGSGGQPRHELELQTGITRNGFGARITGNWQSGTTVFGSSATGADRLLFSDLGTVNLRLFVNLGQQRALVRDHPWLRGTRVSFSFNNLFDQRQRVTDINGNTPFSYQPAYLDPVGRSFRISLRKLLF